MHDAGVLVLNIRHPAQIALNRHTQKVKGLTTKKYISCMRNHFMMIPKNHVKALLGFSWLYL
jgi:hypothetical protein